MTIVGEPTTRQSNKLACIGEKTVALLGKEYYLLQGRIMCLDLGTSRIGVALSDLLGYTAQGAETIQSKGFEADLETIKQLIKKHQVFRLIIGYPLNLDGSEGNKAKAIREQYEAIAAQVGIETILWDERFSTKEAERALDMDQVNWKKKKQAIDRMAAQIILQSYLEYLSLKR